MTREHDAMIMSTEQRVSTIAKFWLRFCEMKGSMQLQPLTSQNRVGIQLVGVSTP